MNCALNDAPYSDSFSTANVSLAACWRPNTLTSAWPVYISSMCALSVPVLRHCSTNCGWDRLAICIVMTAESGIVTTAISARIHEIQNIIASTPTSVSTAWISWLSDCCMVWARLSMSLVTRESTSPFEFLSK